jgi:predicted GIY-YIG superfamily endonuclease
MGRFHYVYMLESVSAPASHYVGFTTDLSSRLESHNAGSVPTTRALRPWCIKTAVAFTDECRARAFERYLKTGSGRAFAKRRF